LRSKFSALGLLLHRSIDGFATGNNLESDLLTEPSTRFASRS
jgi:hypothetical protein